MKEEEDAVKKRWREDDVVKMGGEEEDGVTRKTG